MPTRCSAWRASIPVPVLMVGAGLFLAGSKTGQTVTQKASDIASDLSEDLLQRAHDLGDQVGEFGDCSEKLCIGPVRSHKCRRIGRSRPDQPDCRRCKWRLRCGFQNGSGPGGLTRRTRWLVAQPASRRRASEWRLLPRPPSRIPLHRSEIRWQAGRVTSRNKLVRMASSTGDAVQDIASGAASAARHTANTDRRGRKGCGQGSA